MSKPIEVDLPHKLGRAEARRRIEGNIDKLAGHMPGGRAEVTHTWSGDQLDLKVQAMGQSVDARIAVEEDRVRCAIALPGLLGLFAGPIEAALKAKGSALLLEDKRD